jgi:hypothetical protein
MKKLASVKPVDATMASPSAAAAAAAAVPAPSDATAPPITKQPQAGPLTVQVPPTSSPAPLVTSAQSAPAAAPATPPVGVSPELIAAARRLAAEGKAAEAEKQLTALIPAAPQSRELRKALLEAACLAKSWKNAAAQVPFIAPFADGEEASMFYAAVSFYETGSLESAKVLMAKARPKIAPSPFVDYYARKILGN